MDRLSKFEGLREESFREFGNLVEDSAERLAGLANRRPHPMHPLAEERRSGEIASHFRSHSDPCDRVSSPSYGLAVRNAGRFCWSCGCRRPNERFSRRSSFRGVCRDCYRRGPAELAFRQVVVDVERALRYGELIPRRNPHMIDGLLQHADPRVRAYVADVIARDAQVRRGLVEAYRDDQPFIAPASVSCDADSWDPDDIPF